MQRYDPFTMSTYVEGNGKKRTFFQTSSWGNEPKSSNMKRRVEVRFYGRAVTVYGPPLAELDNLPGHVEMSIDGVLMKTIDLEAKYRELHWRPWDPQPLYEWESRHGDAPHVLEMSLLDSATGTWKWRPIRGFGFDSVVYTSEERLPPKYELRDSEQLEDVKIHDTNFVTTFTPAFAWEKYSSNFTWAAGGARTCRATSNELAYNSWRDLTPVSEFVAQCTALEVYGASPAQLGTIFSEGFRHGHMQICIGRLCDYVDLDRAYLNVPSNLWKEPVLLYSTDRMWPGVLKSVTMRFLDPPSPVGHRWTMSFSHAVCSQVARKWPWAHPMPGGQYSSHVVQYHKLDYQPSFYDGRITPWESLDTYSFAGAGPYWFFGMFGDMPSWSTIVQGHDIKIFIPFPTPFLPSEYSNVQCCIDENCHYPDIEQWFLTANSSTSEVPFVHYKDLNPFLAHRVSMRAVRRADENGDKVIAVSRVEFQRVEFSKQPPTPPYPPAEPSVPLPYPPTPEPVDTPKTGGWTVGLEALLFAAPLVAGYHITLFLLSNAKWLFPWIPDRPLPHNEHCAPPSYVSYGTMDTPPNSPPKSHDPITQPAQVPSRYRA